MLGPLPRLYRWLLAAAAVAVFVGLGAWAGFLAPLPVVAQVGAGIGAAVGVIAAYLLVHDFESRRQPHRARPRERGRR